MLLVCGCTKGLSTDAFSEVRALASNAPTEYQGILLYPLGPGLAATTLYFTSNRRKTTGEDNVEYCPIRWNPMAWTNLET